MLLLDLIVAFFWAFNTVLYLKFFIGAQKKLEKILKISLSTALLIHFASILTRGIMNQYFPIANLFEALSAISFSIGVIYYTIESWMKIRNTGFIILSLMFILHFIAALNHANVNMYVQWENDLLFVSHVSLSIIAYSSFIVAAIYASLYLVLFSHLKSNQFGVFFKRLPSLEELDNMNIKASIIGFILLTPGILFGYFGMKNIYGDIFYTDAKVLISLILWFIYSIQFLAHFYFKWSSRKKAYLSISGFIVLLFSIVGGSLLSNFHRFH